MKRSHNDDDESDDEIEMKKPHDEEDESDDESDDGHGFW